MRRLAALLILLGIFVAQTAVAQAVAAQTPRTKPAPKPVRAAALLLPAPPPEIPFRSLTLANGLRVILLSDPHLPIWRASIKARAGSDFDQPGKPGLAGLTAQTLLRTGTADRTPAEIRQTVRQTGVSWSGLISLRHAELSFAGPASSGPEALSTLHDHVTRPLFRRSVVEELQRFLLQRTRGQHQSLRDTADREFSDAFTGKRGAQHIEIHTEDLSDFYRRWWDPSNAVLVLTGDFEPDLMAKKITAEWSAWPSHGRTAAAAAKADAPAAPQLILHSPENTPESAVTFGYLLSDLTIEEEAATQIFAALWEAQGGRVRAALRSPLQFVISAGSVGEASRPFRVSADPPVRETVDLVRELLAAKERALAAPASASDLQAAKRRILDNFAARFDRPWKTADFAGQMLLAGHQDFPKRFHAAVSGMPAATVNKLAAVLLAPNRLVVSLAGDERDFRDPAASLGFPVRKTGAPVAGVAATGEPPAPVPGDDQRGVEWLAKMRDALGGLAALEKISDGEWSYKVSFHLPSGAVSLNQKIRWLRSGAIRHEESIASASSIVYSDGKMGWSWRRQQKEPLGRSAVTRYREELFRTPYTLAVSDRIAGHKVSYLGSAIIRVAGEDGARVDIALDEATHLPESYRYSHIAANGRPAPIEERLAAYKSEGGIMVPGRIDIYESGRLIAEFELSGIRFNSGFTQEDLAKIP